MTPQERQLVTELFERLERLEGAPRDRDAEQAIAEGLRYAPNALYPLVQTVLVQDEALKRADARIRDLEDELDQGGQPPQQGGFLEGMRDKLFGERGEPRGSVPSVRPEGAPMGAPPGFRTGVSSSPYGAAGQEPGGPAGPGGPGGSFLGSAAAAAAGAIGGAMMLQGIRSMFGGQHGGLGAMGSGAGAGAGSGATPWAGGGGSGDVPGDLARQVKLDDLVGGGKSGGDDNRGQEQSYGVADNASQEDDSEEDDEEFDGDFADDFDGDTDTA
jgi:hypothetical protein